MSRSEINSEIQKILSNLPDESLNSILKYLKEIQKIDSSKLLISKNLGKILTEDAQLLKKLAE